jgi:hypothetical protein
LSEELSVLRLVGEIGNKFFDSSDAFYAWRPEAFQLEDVQNQINEATRRSAMSDDADSNLTEIPQPMKERRSPNSPMLSPKRQDAPALPEKGDSGMNGKNTSSPAASTSPRQTSGLSRSNTISSYLSTAYEKAASNVSSLNAVVAKVTAASVGGEKYDRLKQDAIEAEEAYRAAVMDLEDAR